MQVSILISLYNAEQTLDQTFESLLHQTLTDFQIIAINDASTDTTLAKLLTWQETFGSERFLLIDNPTNLGLTHSLNLGLEKIQTPYTARLDSDDWWEPSKLEQQIHFLQENPDYGIIGTSYINHLEKKEVVVSPPASDPAIKATLFKRNPFAHSAVVFRTELVRQVGSYDTTVRYGQDYDLWLRLLPKTRFANIVTPLCHRNAIDTLSSRKQSEQMLQCVKTQLKYLRLYQRPLWDYRYISEPLLVALTPHWIRQLKRKFLV